MNVILKLYFYNDERGFSNLINLIVNNQVDHNSREIDSVLYLHPFWEKHPVFAHVVLSFIFPVIINTLHYSRVCRLLSVFVSIGEVSEGPI